MRAALALGLALSLVACAHTAPPPEPPAAPAFDGVALVRAIRAAGAASPTELDVQPLRDTAVEDLRQQAMAHERAGRIGEAIDALDEALAISPDDPAVLQERAEAALLAGDLDAARLHARRASGAGTDVGPLCRRHFETLLQVAQVQDDGEAASAARTRRDACTVAAPARY